MNISHHIHVIGEKGQIFGSGNELYCLPAGSAQPALQTFRDVDTFTAQIEHFVNCLRTGARPLHSVEEGRAVLEIILKAAEDAKGWQKFAVTKG